MINLDLQINGKRLGRTRTAIYFVWVLPVLIAFEFADMAREAWRWATGREEPYE